jgi:hypothetical protein
VPAGAEERILNEEIKSGMDVANQVYGVFEFTSTAKKLIKLANSIRNEKQGLNLVFYMGYEKSRIVILKI